MLYVPGEYERVPSATISMTSSDALWIWAVTTCGWTGADVVGGGAGADDDVVDAGLVGVGVAEADVAAELVGVARGEGELDAAPEVAVATPELVDEDDCGELDVDGAGLASNATSTQ